MNNAVVSTLNLGLDQAHVEAGAHHPNVEFIWYTWPFSVILAKPVADFLHGHGLNLLNNILYDILYTPILIWNTIMGSIFPQLGAAVGVINFAPNAILGTISGVLFFVPDLIYGTWNVLTKAVPTVIVYVILYLPAFILQMLPLIPFLIIMGPFILLFMSIFLFFFDLVIWGGPLVAIV